MIGQNDMKLIYLVYISHKGKSHMICDISEYQKRFTSFSNRLMLESPIPSVAIDTIADMENGEELVWLG